MAGSLEDLTCKDCGIRWGDSDGEGWFLQFGNDPDPKQNKLLWAQCPGCQPGERRFAVDVARDIRRLPENVP